MPPQIWTFPFSARITVGWLSCETLALGDGGPEKTTEVGQNGAWLWGSGCSWRKVGGRARELKRRRGSLVKVDALYGLS